MLLHVLTKPSETMWKVLEGKFLLDTMLNTLKKEV